MIHTSSMVGSAPGGGTPPKFGNWMLNEPATGVAPNKCQDSVVSASKDHSERFLDEIYRYSHNWNSTQVPNQGIQANYLANLAGPGLPFVTGPIEVPVRAGYTMSHATIADLPWEKAAWVQYNKMATALTANGAELQVAGLPDRNPPLDEGNDEPYPSAGRLMIPKIDYMGNNALGGPIRPSLASGDITTAQFPYNGVPAAISFAGLEQNYVRAFDANFSRSTNNAQSVQSGPVVADGQPFVYLRIWGVTPSDFEYEAGWPYGNKHMAILVKVPGLTTWMDIGRNDGSGPSKQDPVHDGAGCRVVGPQTRDGVGDPYSNVWQSIGVDQIHACGVVYSQVKINVGPNVNLFKSSGEVANMVGTNEGEAPVLVKVVMRYDENSSPDTLKYDFAHSYIGGVFSANPNPNAKTRDMRGIVGIELIRPDNA